MRMEKQGSKGGNYVGGFLQMFDWNVKSRKKLFSSKSEVPGMMDVLSSRMLELIAYFPLCMCGIYVHS